MGQKTTAEALYKETVVPAGGNFGMITTDLDGGAETDKNVPKFRNSGITLIRAGGAAGLFSAIIPGWLMNGEAGTNPVTKEIKLMQHLLDLTGELEPMFRKPLKKLKPHLT